VEKRPYQLKGIRALKKRRGPSSEKSSKPARGDEPRRERICTDLDALETIK